MDTLRNCSLSHHRATDTWRTKSNSTTERASTVTARNHFSLLVTASLPRPRITSISQMSSASHSITLAVTLFFPSSTPPCEWPAPLLSLISSSSRVDALTEQQRHVFPHITIRIDAVTNRRTSPFPPRKSSANVLSSSSSSCCPFSISHLLGLLHEWEHLR